MLWISGSRIRSRRPMRCAEDSISTVGAITLLDRAALLKAEEELLLAIDRAGTRKPLLDRMAPDAVLYRNGEPPITDNGTIRKTIEAAMPPFAWRPARADVAASGDIAYSYGSYVMGNEKGNYLRIWRLSQQGEWLIIVDLTDPDA